VRICTFGGGGHPDPERDTGRKTKTDPSRRTWFDRALRRVNGKRGTGQTKSLMTPRIEVEAKCTPGEEGSEPGKKKNVRRGEKTKMKPKTGEKPSPRYEHHPWWVGK